VLLDHLSRVNAECASTTVQLLDAFGHPTSPLRPYGGAWLASVLSPHVLQSISCASTVS
jgi:hypothetical protein